MEVFLTGLLAGLALAIPLGPMAILLISTTMKHGRVIGSFGALAMATVDLSYAALVFAFGSAVIALLSDWAFWMRLVGSLILLFVGFKIYLDAKASIGIFATAQLDSKASVLGTFAKFFALTVLNPATAFYFIGITPSVAAISEDNAIAFTLVFFAVGVFLGSVVWQFTLVFAAGLTAKFTDANFQRRVQYLGAGLIVALALILLIN